MDNNNDKYVAATTKVVNSIIKNFEKLENIGANNDVSEEHKTKIFSAIKKSMDKSKKAFNSDNKRDEFKLD